MLTIPNVSSTTGQGGFAVNGNRPRNNNYMVDGSDNNDISVTISTSQIVPEAVAEFQVLQNPYSVEFGRNSGGQVNVITKSGTNRFTGDAWDYYQSSGLNSRTNIEKANNLATPPKEIRHQAGGALGGPIFQDRLFFFGM
jgi:outer membrane receptor for ferrienterochelin and colicin